VNSHIRLALTEVFGSANFRNEIVRIKCNPKNYTTSGFGNIHDTIFFFTRSEETKLNRMYEERDNEQLEHDFSRIEAETGRRYTTGALHAKGIRFGATGKPWRAISPPSGNHWRYVPETLDQFDADGLIEWSSTGNPRLKRYADDDEGKAVQTITMPHTLPMILQWDESFDIGSDTLTGVNDADYQPPFALTAKLNKLTIKVDRPQLAPEDIKKLEAAMTEKAKRD
jgi:adenine-specific DNA-methyltransferase